MEVAIFSYNRGKYLKNCVESIIRNIPSATFKIYDDGSTDPETVEYLDELESRVIRSSQKIKDRHGGYYRNMQRAVENASSNFLLLIQEDMQIVRQLDESDISSIETIFRSFPDAAFLSPIFLKGRKRKLFTEHYLSDEKVAAYKWIESSGATVPACYADVSIVFVPRLLNAGWIFQNSEAENGFSAKVKFGRMPQLANPFTFYLPEEPAYRGKTLTLGARLAFEMSGRKIKNFIDMTRDQNLAFIARDQATLPFAEDFLQTEDPKVKKPYKFNGYRKSWLTLLLNKLELLFR